ncbi:MAG TPA: hypothetical protein VMF13_12355, partial [Luteitalea sp.]|nr:hypothetical protein [Luteitalea sp.]
MPVPSTLDALVFDATFIQALPGDPDTRNVSRPAPGVSYTPVEPTAVRAPSLLAWSDDMGARLGLERPP